MADLHLTYLNRPDVEALELSDDEILRAVEGGLRAQGSGETVIEPRVHLRPDQAFRGHFNVLRGYIAPLGRPASRWWATSSATTSSGCRPRTGC